MKIDNYMIGTDFSHHNEINIEGCGSQGFIFLKASEGVSYMDKKMNNFLTGLSIGHNKNMPFIGFYHYARPENGNTPTAEADHFVRTIMPHIGNCMCALDIEGDALSFPNIQKWALEWLNHVRSRCDTNPILYVQASSANKFELITRNFPLWVACYSQDSRVKKYAEVIEKAKFVQITSHPIDIDIFKGSPLDMARIIKR